MAIARTEFVAEGGELVEQIIAKQTQAINQNTAAQNQNLQVVRRARTEYGQANDAAQLLGRTLGVQLPRELNKVLASSKLIGPALAAAFNVAVVGGFAVAVASLIPKIRDLADEIGGLGKATKEWGEELVKANNALLTGFTTREGGQRFLSEVNRRIEGLEKEKAVMEEMSKLRGIDQTSIGMAIAARLRLREIEDELVAAERLRAQVGERLLGVTEKENEEDRKRNKILQEQAEAYDKLWRARLAGFTAASGRVPVAVRQREALDALQGRNLPPTVPEFPVAVPSSEEIQRTVELLDKVAPVIKRTTQSFEEWRAAVQSLAGELRALAENPLEYLKNRFKQMIFEMIAAALLGGQRIGQGLFGGISGGAQGQQGGGGIFGQLLGGLFGGGGFGSATAPGGTGTFTGAPIPGVGSASGSGAVDFNGTPLPVGAAQGSASIANQDLLTRVRGFFGQGALSQRGAIGVGIAGLLGSLLSGSSNRGVRALGGALTGGSIGFAFGGPIGAAIGAAIGGLIGLFTGPNFGKMRDRFLRDQFRPAVDRVVDAYNLHQLDYGSAIAQLEQLRQQGVDQLRQLKGNGARAHDVIDDAIAKINSTEQARQSALQRIGGLPVPEFARGGFVTGAMGQPVPVLAHGGEAVLNLQQQAMVGVGRIREAFRSTGTAEAPRSGSFASGGFVGGDGPVHVTIHALDGADVERVINRNPAAFARGIRRIARNSGRKSPI